jgi:hypothetical protein
MRVSQIASYEKREVLSIADETPVKAMFREWLADQFSPEKNNENRRLNNQEEFKVLRRILPSFIPLVIAYVVAILLLFFLKNVGPLLTLIMTLILVVVYIIQGLRSARCGVSNRIRSNKTKFLRLKSEAVVLLKLIPEDADYDDVLEAFRETDVELRSLNSIDKTALGFLSKAFTTGPFTLIALAYLFNILGSMDTKAFIEGNKVLGSALSSFIAMGLVVAFINDFVITIRTLRSERIAQIIAIAQDTYKRRFQPSNESTDKRPLKA